MNGDALVADYLTRLDAAAARLTGERRRDLVEEIRDHIAAAVAEAGARDELTVRNVLDRLGEPDEIVAAELEPGDVPSGGAAAATWAPPVASPQPAGWGALEIAAVLLLTVGSVLLPFIGPLIGLILAWASPRWTTREKSIATAIAFVLIFALPLLLVLATSAPSLG